MCGVIMQCPIKVRPTWFRSLYSLCGFLSYGHYGRSGISLKFYTYIFFFYKYFGYFLNYALSGVF
jgi:hypothetical protein